MAKPLALLPSFDSPGRRPRKWTQGRPVFLAELANMSPTRMLWLRKRASGGTWMGPGRPISASYVRNWSLHRIMWALNRDELYLAEQRPEYREWLRAELLGEESL